MSAARADKTWWRVVAPVIIAISVVIAALSASVVRPAAGTTSGASPAAADPGRPDVIVIMTDDQRVGTEKGMPFLWDELRPEMTYYPNAQVPVNNCCPARSSFLSGHSSLATGVWDNTWLTKGPRARGGWKAFFRSGYEKRTIATALRKRRYRTVLLGKYLNQYDKFRNPRKDKPPGWVNFHTYVTSNGGYWDPPRPIAGIPQGYATDTLGDAAVKVITNTPENKPVFVMYTPYAPHRPSNAGPYHGAADVAGVLDTSREAGEWTNPAIGEADRSDKPRFNRVLPDLAEDGEAGSPFPKVRRFSREHADTLMGVDANIRKIVDAQREYRDWDNTLLVFLSDNGVAWGDHALFDKTTPYRLTNGIPLLIKYPKGSGQADTDRRLINQLDVTATIARLTSAQLRTEGRSATRVAKRPGLLLVSPTSKTSYPWWHPSYCGWRTKDALYVRYRQGSEELYDYTNDPYELRNRAGAPAYRELQAEMKVNAHLRCDPPPPDYAPVATAVRLTPAGAGASLTLSPGIPGARLVVERRTFRGWVKVGVCRVPGPPSSSSDVTVTVALPGTYRAHSQPIGAFRASPRTAAVRIAKSTTKFSCS